jgi:FkbM family methyltransferase
MVNIAPAGVRPEIAGELEIRSTSQYGQDAWLYNVFHDILPTAGSFLEFGGRDGVLDSNTHFYDKVLKYKGFLVESVPDEYRKLVENRERAGVNTYHGLVCAHGEKKKLFAYDLQLAGLGMIFTEAERAQVVSKLETIAKERKSVPDIKEVELECYDLQDLASKNDLDGITIMSVDCEGCELPILKDFDFSKHQVSIILVEINENIEAILKVLFANGFVPVDARTSDIILVHVDFLRKSKKLFSHYQSVMELDAQGICKFLNLKSDKDALFS